MNESAGRLTAYEVLTAPVAVRIGHFGAGKSEIAVNLAFGWRFKGEHVSVIDLDLVKPYFRSRLPRDDMQGTAPSGVGRDAVCGTAHHLRRPGSRHKAPSLGRTRC
jgi:Mrp family chromosome partitioning ATPase